MKKFLVLVALCLTAFSCRHSYESPFIPFDHAGPDPKLLHPDLDMAFCVNNKADSEVNMSLWRTIKWHGDDFYTIESENSLTKIFSANSDDCYPICFFKQLDEGKSTDYVSSTDYIENIDAVSFIAEIEGKKFLGFGRNEKVVEKSTGQEVALGEVAQDGLGEAIFQCVEKNETEKSATYQEGRRNSKHFFKDADGVREADSDMTEAIYDVTIDGDGATFKLKQVGRGN